ncbi:IBR domain-containing protein [Diaporthe helianthi]|uniref:IBR domain-containing protein n=1 Tax=Diaporthe helianthi TaxID=158607 RepID=A0A2P5IEY8_DIAHE|nr:IBR domain-containing protein [Diaporthe helianthi]
MTNLFKRLHRHKTTRSTCLCCYDQRAAIKLSCQHAYCKECFRQLVLNAVQSEQYWPPKCCGRPINDIICLKSIPRRLRGVYKYKKYEYSVPADQRYYCPWPDCGVFVPEDKDNTPYCRARCKRKHVTCKKCLGFAHLDPVYCPQNRDMEVVIKMAFEHGWQRCWKCRTMIEHTGQCRHMSCRCGAEFCFVYGAKWWTCGCTERQLKQLKERIANSAALRRAQEGREAQEQR